MRFYDLHSHSVASDDSRATVEQYLKWIRTLRNRGMQVDGIVLTEHRQFSADVDYTALSREYGVTVLTGAELDTRHGHFLVYGMTEKLAGEIDLADVRMDAHALMDTANAHDAIAVPAHPGRAGIGLAEWIDRGVEFPQVKIVERLNAGNRPEEAHAAERLAEERNYSGIGGSDAHFVSAIARCMTAFPAPVSSGAELVEALRAGDFQAVRLEDTQRPQSHVAREEQLPDDNTAASRSN